MKKKHNPFILVILLSFLMPSCSQEETLVNTDKTILTKQVGIKSAMVLTSVKELNDVCRYEDAVLFVTSPGCHYCEAQRPILEEYIAKTQNLIYEISYPYYKEAYSLEENKTGSYANLYPKLVGTPSFLFYKNGKLVNSHSGILGETLEEFEENFTPYVFSSNLYHTNDFEYLNQSKETEPHYLIDENGLYLSNTSALLEETLEKNPSSVVLYTWRRCKDCSAYKTEVLYPYLSSHPDVTLFVYELDGFYQKKREEGEEIKKEGLLEWSSFSEKMGLYTDEYFYTDAYGNKAGLAPTIVYYGENRDLSVYLNDFDVRRNDDGTLSYHMAFYPEVRELRSKTKVEQGDTVSDQYRKALSELSSFAKPIETENATSFLEEYLK